MPFNASIPFVPSPNFSGRGGWRIDGIVIHYTAGGKASGTIRWLCNPQARASAHFVISRDGRITQLVDLGMKAWHAGVSKMALSSGEMTPDANRFTVGIELANYGWLQNNEDEFFYELAGKSRKARIDPNYPPQFAELAFDNNAVVSGWWEPYADRQLDSLDWLVKEIARIHPKAGGNIVGHESIAMPFSTRKRDPGPLFPWTRFGGLARQRTLSRVA